MYSRTACAVMSSRLHAQCSEIPDKVTRLEWEAICIAFVTHLSYLIDCLIGSKH